MSTGNIERRLKALEDIEEIKVLKAQQMAYADDYDAEGVVSLFTDDAVMDAGIRGRYEGRQEIFEFVKGACQRLPFFVHWVMNPIIEVDGDTGKGSWYLLQASTVRKTNDATWSSGRYDEEYVRVDGHWRFKNVNLTLFFWTPFDQGWVKKRSVWS